MTKHVNILKRLEACLGVLLVVCLALVVSTGIAWAEQTDENTRAVQTYHAADSKTSSDESQKKATFVSLSPFDLGCTKERMDLIYKTSCYACDVVTALISSFMSACTYLYDVSRDAGSKILFIGVMLWIAFYVLKQLSSLKNLEPAAMVNEMLIMAFKVIGAYLVINAGIDFFIDYVIVPFMNFGAEFGIAMLASAQDASGLDIENIKVNSAYAFEGGLIPDTFMNNLLKYVAAVDYTVSTHLEIGHLLTCYATHVKAYNWVITVIPNIWLWFSGVLIWFAGFMMTLSVAYYLVDISFKLGFAIIALPITVGLWPFNITKGKLTACFSIILRSAGILIFLAMTVAAGLALVSAALNSGDENSVAAVQEASGGVSKLMTAIENNDADFVSEHFAFWGFAWIVILFAYLFAIKIIGSTMTDYVDKFFKDSVFGNKSPMHMEMTKKTDLAKKAAMRPIKFGGKVASHQGGKFANKLLGGGIKAASLRITRGASLFFGDKKKDDDDGLLDKAQSVNKKVDQLSQGKLNNEEDGQNKKKSMLQSTKSMTGLDADKDKQAMKKQDKGENGGSGGGAGKAMQQSGENMKEAGQQIKQTADNIDQNLASADQSIKAGNQSVNAAAHAGTAATFGIAAPVTETAAAASNTATAASSAALNAGRVAAKAMKVTGEVLEKTGKVLEKAGKATEKAEKAVNKASKAINKVTGKAKQISDNIPDTDSRGSDEEQQQQSDGIIEAASDQIFSAGNKKK